MFTTRPTKYFVEFPSFDAAKPFAVWAASPSGFNDERVAIRRSGATVSVVLPYALSIDLACKHIYYRCRGFVQAEPSREILAILEPDLRPRLQSTALAWKDSGSGLTWDVARHFMRSPHPEHPDNCANLMNALSYAGHTDWRMPTLAELRTLGNDRYLHLGLLSHGTLVSYRTWLADSAADKALAAPSATDRLRRINRPRSPPMLDIWSGELPQHGDCDDYIGLNLHDLQRFTQGYSEENRRYHRSAHTVLVRGSMTPTVLRDSLTTDQDSRFNAQPAPTPMSSLIP